MKKIGIIFCIISTVAAFNPYSFSCSTNDDCEKFIPEAKCDNFTCICPPGKIISGDLTRCIEISVGYGILCSEDIQCSEYLLNGGHCYNQQCKCEENFHYRDGRCYQTKQIGESCFENSECYNGFDIEALICVDNTCKCNTNPLYYSRTPSDCRRAGTKDGAACLIDLDCTYSSKATCVNFKCKTSKFLVEETEIILNKKVKDDENVIEPSVTNVIYDIGEPCQEDNDCNATNSWCYQSTCQCQRGYLNNNSCVPELGSNANSQDDCQYIKYSVYRDEKCLCPVGFAYASNNLECYKGTQKIEYSCTRDENCYTFGPTSKCINWKCECVGEDWYDDNIVMCHHPAGINEPCTNDTDCKINPDLPITSPVCNLKTNKCDCPENFYYVPTEKYCQNSNSVLGDSCYQSSDCQSIANSECINGICSCSDSFYASDGICKNGPGHHCDSNVDCIAPNTFCSNDECVCKEDYLLVNEICYKVSSGINGECEVIQQCQAILNNGSSCIDNHCFCTDNYHLYENKCWQNKQLGDYCSYKAECQFEANGKTDIECRNGKCQCILGANQEGNLCFSSSGAVSTIFTTAILSILVLLLIV